MSTAGMSLRQYVEVFNRVAAREGLDAGIAAVVETALKTRVSIRYSDIVDGAAESVLQSLEARHRLNPGAIRSRDRSARVSLARFHAYRALREMGFSYPDIGRFIGGRDHHTVIAGIQALRAREAAHAERRAA